VTTPAVVVLRHGLLTTIQDHGRPGLAHMAVPRSGAADLPSLELANRLVGNSDDAAAFETTLLGADLQFTDARWVAVTGANAIIRIDGRSANMYRAQYVPAGGVLAVGNAIHGVRSYIAISGGIAVPAVLGSRSTDTLSGLGPASASDGAALPLGSPVRSPAAIDIAPQPRQASRIKIRLIPGPRYEWVTAEAQQTLETAAYEVSTDSNRIGVRLLGPKLEMSGREGLPSEGILLGAVQVPPSGQPLIFLPDHPTTGGYPVIGVVHPRDLRLVAQSRPGDQIEFMWRHLLI
jgi:biotin-dependent carboxylase-like uncharacterized protein